MPDQNIVCIQVLLEVTDAKEVISMGKQMADVDSLEDCLYEVANNPSNPPIDCGYEVLQGPAVTRTDDGKHLLTLKVQVNDTALLEKCALEAYEDCWGGSDFAKDNGDDYTLADLLYELAVASNNSPSPSDCGYLIIRRV
ncbi:hypothetical protein RYA05_03710 [Pseudomonas syringae pv. actinidiae]|nr:hypothetical protein [Pseudomonas syringae pv. actinidiae]